MVDILDYISCYTQEELEEIGVNEKVRFSVLCEILDSCNSDEELRQMIKERARGSDSKAHHQGRHLRHHQLPVLPGQRRRLG